MAILGVTQAVVTHEKSGPDTQLAAARKVASTIAREFGMSPKDLLVGLQARFEELGKRPGRQLVANPSLCFSETVLLWALGLWGSVSRTKRNTHHFTHPSSASTDRQRGQDTQKDLVARSAQDAAAKPKAARRKTTGGDPPGDSADVAPKRRRTKAKAE